MLKRGCYFICCYLLLALGLAADNKTAPPGDWQQGVIYTFRDQERHEIVAVPVWQLHVPHMIGVRYFNGSWWSREDVIQALVWQRDTKTIHTEPFVCPPVQCREWAADPQPLKPHEQYDFLSGYSKFYLKGGNPYYVAWFNQVMLMTGKEPQQRWLVQSDNRNVRLLACSLLANSKKQVLVIYEKQVPNQETPLEQVALYDLNTKKLIDLPNINRLYLHKEAVTFALWLNDSYVALPTLGRHTVSCVLVNVTTDTLTATLPKDSIEQAPDFNEIRNFFVADDTLWGLSESREGVAVFRLLAPEQQPVKSSGTKPEK